MERNPPNTLVAEGVWHAPAWDELSVGPLGRGELYTASFFDLADKRTPKVACGTIDFDTNPLVSLASVGRPPANTIYRPLLKRLTHDAGEYMDGLRLECPSWQPIPINILGTV